MSDLKDKSTAFRKELKKLCKEVKRIQKGLLTAHQELEDLKKDICPKGEK